jgi:hypothetical protein
MYMVALLCLAERIDVIEINSVELRVHEIEGTEALCSTRSLYV